MFQTEISRTSESPVESSGQLLGIHTELLQSLGASSEDENESLLPLINVEC